MGTQLADTTVTAAVISAKSVDGSEHEEMLTRIGQITRTLHDSLRELGFDKVLEKMSMDIPDVKASVEQAMPMIAGFETVATTIPATST